MEQISNRSRLRTPARPHTGLRALTVDFYLYSSHEVAVWEPIWRVLRRRGVDAQFVLEPPGVHPALGSVPDSDNGWFDDKDGPVEPLVNDETYQEIQHALHSLGLGHIDRSRVDADAAITTQGVGWLLHYREALRIKTEYGASAFAGAYGHGSVNQGHDMVLSHGAFSKGAISAHFPPLRIRIAGYPKWAPTLRARPTTAEARAALEVDSELPILAWLPTWAQNSGIDRYADALAELADRFLIIAKPHHNNVRFETERLESIDPRIVVRTDLHSLVPLLMAADIAVTDSRSGALAETFLADRPVVGLLPAADPAASGVPKDLEDAVVWCSDPSDLTRAVGEALTTDRSEARGRWRRWLFADLANRDDEVAADVLIDALRDHTPQTTSSLPLTAVDDLIAATDLHDSADIWRTVERAWPLWPTHPSLLALIEKAGPDAPAPMLLALSRLVRESKIFDACPLVALMNDPHADPLRRLSSAALAAIELEDEDASDRFQELVDEIPTERFDETFYELDLTPEAIPVFVQLAATSSDRCRMLARGLDRLGAQEEAEAVSAYGATLVNQ